MSDDVRMIAAKRAIQLLTASGMEYAVRMPDGSLAGTLKIADPVTKKPKQVKNHFEKDYAYIKTLEAMEVNGSYKWTMPTKELAVSFQRSVCGTASRKWGNDSYITTVVDCTVEILRLA